MSKSKGYLSVYINEELKDRLDKISQSYKIPRNRLVINILDQVVLDFESVIELSKYQIPVGAGRIFFVDRYLEK